MAHKLASLSILFLLLLLAFSPVLGEHQGSKEADVNQFNDDKHHGGCHPCRHGCCSAEEYAEFVKKEAAADFFGHGCRHFCHGRCCSAEEYAEFVKKEATADFFGHGCRHFCHGRCCSAAEFAEFTKQAAGQH